MRAHFVREMPMSCMLRSKLDGRGEVKLQASFQGWTGSGAEGRVTPPQVSSRPSREARLTLCGRPLPTQSAVKRLR